jgi:DNA polymerase-1
LVKEVLEAFHIPVFEKPGYEGDDLIGTISRLSIEENPLIRNIIVSGDNDVFQLVNDRSEIYYLKKGVKDTALCGKDFVFEKFGGLTPLQIIDYKALRGDQSDNIPGVVGIGEKTAIDLVLRFGGLGGIYDAIERGDKGIKDGVRDKLLNNKENAFLSLDLAKIITDAPIEMGDVSACEWRDYDKKKMIDILFSFGFKSLIPKLPGGIIEEDINVIEREPEVGGNLKLW